MFINLTNHPSSSWSQRQLDEAWKYGAIVDRAFPVIDPYMSDEDVRRTAQEIAAEVKAMNPGAVLCQGEFTLTYALVQEMKAYGITVVAACSQRCTEETSDENGNTIKNSVFRFVQFRNY
jgi:ABC-type branched-subunit amino acid transport system substrate-binding protein